MLFRILIAGVMLLQVLVSSAVLTTRPLTITAANNRATIDFPERINFQVDLESSADITEVLLEYRVEQMTCGKLISKSFPDYEPGKQVSAAWSWEMKQSGSLPPGAKIYWRWKVKDADGNTLVTDEQHVTWLDDVHLWKSLSQGHINLHWYQGDDAFGQELLDNGVQSLEMLREHTGLKPDGEIDIYIYASPEELTEAVFFMPDWTGGLAYPENNIVLIGISDEEMNWGKHAQTHELTHVLVGRLTFSCLGDLPTWLNEGLAKYSEGDWNENDRAMLESAIKSGDLISVRALSSSFPEDDFKARQAYAQSHSLVAFLIAEYGQEKLLHLLARISQGITTDEGLVEIYGFDQDGLEDAWRAKVKAAPRHPEQVAPTPVFTATPIPTIAPVSEVPPVITLSPTLQSGPSSAPTQPSIPQPGEEPLAIRNLYIVLSVGGCLCAAALVVIAGAVLFVALKGRTGKLR